MKFVPVLAALFAMGCGQGAEAELLRVFTSAGIRVHDRVEITVVPSEGSGLAKSFRLESGAFWKALDTIEPAGHYCCCTVARIELGSQGTAPPTANLEVYEGPGMRLKVADRVVIFESDSLRRLVMSHLTANRTELN